MEHILVIDVGTSSLKAMLYNNSGGLLFRSSQEYHSEVFHNNRVEQSAFSWKDALLYTLTETGKFVHDKKIDVVAMSVTSQRASVIPVTREGEPLHKAIMWQDKRSVEQCNQLSQHLSLRDIYLRTGLRLNPYFSVPKMMWLKDNEPEIFSQTHKMLGVQDYVIYLLTNKFITDWTQACRTMLMNITSFKWDEDLLRHTGISVDLLPELVPPGSVAGPLTKEISELTGLPLGIPVIIAGGDQQCAALALNVLRPGDAEANTGTGSFAIAYSDQAQFDDECRTLCSAAAIPGKWIVEAGIFNSGSIHRWFREEFYPEGENVYDLMNEEAAQSPVGSNGVMLLPHFEGSAAPYWNPMAKGMFFNLSLATKRCDFTRSILEGIALEIKSNLSLIENLIGDISMVSVAGGLTTLELFNQIQSDAFNKIVIRYDNNEASSLGALMSAGVTIKIYTDYDAALKKISTTDPLVYHPDVVDVEKYAKLFIRKNALYQSMNQHGVYDLFKEVL